VVHAEVAGDLGGPVARPVVDDEPFDVVEALDPPREVRDGRGQGRRLVEARNLDDQLQS
jgi:hypothetical protein